jgi:hypothetical protein
MIKKSNEFFGASLRSLRLSADVGLNSAVQAVIHVGKRKAAGSWGLEPAAWCAPELRGEGGSEPGDAKEMCSS